MSSERSTRHRRSTLTALGIVLLLALTCMPAVSANSVRPASVLLSGYPPARQQHPLSCEAAATSMATRGILSEDRILARMPINVDPNLGYRGNWNGQYIIPNLPNYGVYPGPVARVLASYGWHSQPVTDMTVYGLKRYLSFGWPVVLWITYQLAYETPYWKTQGGHRFLLVPEEHAVTAIGYTRRDIIVDDPYVGEQREYAWSDFLRSWNYLERMALAVRPCKAPAPVRDIESVRSYWTIHWTWHADRAATRYDLRIYQRRDGSWRFIKHVSTAGTAVTVRGVPQARGYLIRVQGVTSCGLMSRAQYGYSAHYAR